MKNISLLLAIMLVCVGSVSAQVTVEVMMSQNQFLPGESIPVKVRVVNNSGQTLRFGQETWLTYSLEGENGAVAMKMGDAPIPHDFEVKSSEMATTHADLGPCYTITKPGRYKVTANAYVKDWNRTVSSQPFGFYVVSGTRLWEQSFGLPQLSTNHSEPEVRKYILQQATMVDHMNLYLRVTDGNEAGTIHISRVGPLISFSNPQMHLDKFSNLHLLYQESARLYSYRIYNPDGELALRQTYYYANSAPRLSVDADGEPVILGGLRHVADTDLPSARKPLLTNEIPPPAPAPAAH